MVEVKRDGFFDSLKFILICFVVVGHVIERGIFKTYDHDRVVVFSFIYTFHMPLFIFISGYFSKTLTWAKYKKSFVSLFVTYIVFQTIYSIPSMIDGTFGWVEYLTLPQSVLWYVIGLLFWRFCFSFIPKQKNLFPVVLGITLLLAYGIHFVSKENHFYTRIIAFFPYFVLGYYCPSNIIAKIRGMNKVFSVAFLAVLFVMIYFFVNLNFLLSQFGGMAYHRYPSILTGVLLISLCYVLAIATSACVINLATDRFAKLGSTTLDIYLLHPIYVYSGYNLLLESFGWNPPVAVDILAAVPIILFCLFLSKLKITKYFTDPVSVFRKKSKK